ncbi:MAG: hypothetical protein EXS16_06990 [Gemmataceae bacterium]|nr:hypothetical protein [Gemmataceae bacterium]
MPIGYVFTILIETPILCVGLSSEHTMWRRVQAGCWLTACTYPIVVLVLPVAVRDYGIYLAFAETFAPLAECVLFWVAFAPLKQPMRDMPAIVLANLASFGIGMQYAMGLIG